MGFFQKLREIFTGEKIDTTFNLDFDEEKNQIILKANFDINSNEKIKELTVALHQ